MNPYAGKYIALRSGTVHGFCAVALYKYQKDDCLFIAKQDIIVRRMLAAGLGRKHCTATRVSIPLAQLCRDFKILT